MAYVWHVASLAAQLVKNPPAMRDLVWSLGWEEALEKGKIPTPVFWPGEFHGLYSAWGRKESDKTEQLSLYVWHALIDIVTDALNEGQKTNVGSANKDSENNEAK